LQLKFFIAFKSKYLDVEVAFPKFHAFKPWWVGRLTTGNKCCCHYHQEVELFVVLTPQINVSIDANVMTDVKMAHHVSFNNLILN